MTHRSTIHRKFIAVVVTVVIPFLLLDLYWVYENAEESKQAVQANAQLLATLIATNLDERFSMEPVVTPSSLQHFSTVLNNLNWPDETTVILIDRQGIIAARQPHTDGWAGQSIQQFGFVKQPGDTNQPLFVPTAQQKDQFWGMATSANRLWQVVVGIPIQTAYADAWRDMGRNLLFMGLITLIVVGMARYWSRRITLPLRQLTERMEAVKTTDLPAHLKVNTHDETQRLAESFNIMTDKLRERETEKAELFTQLEQHQTDLKLLSAQLLKLQEDERRRVARELHDEVGQALGAITLNLQVAERTMNQDPQRASEHLTDAKAIARRARQEINRIAHDLRPSILDDFGLTAALRWYTTDFAKRTGIAVELEVDNIAERLSPEIEVTLYRMVQEALTNSFKHANATTVRTVLKQHGQTLSLEIQDDGQGFHPDHAANGHTSEGRLGILGMRERAAYLGATFSIDSSPGRGTTLRLEVPQR